MRLSPQDTVLTSPPSETINLVGKKYKMEIDLLPTIYVCIPDK